MPENDFHPQFDAQTLAEAEAIKADPRRSTAAREAAGELSNITAAQTVGLRRIARQSPERRGPASKESAVMESGDGRQIPITRTRR